MAQRTVRGLLLDVGGVVIRTPFELLAPVERAHGLADGALGPRGPFDEDGDPEFGRVVAGDLAEGAYWRRRARRAAPLLGTEPGTRSFFRALFDLEEDRIVRPAVRTLVEDARAAGLRVGALTNDLHDFHGEGWVDRISLFGAFDVLVDGSLTGVLKPDREAYAIAVRRMGLPPAELVLLDDQPVNVRGAEEAGIRASLLDPVDPGPALAAVRALLGLPHTPS